MIKTMDSQERQTVQTKRILDCVDSLLPMIKKPKNKVWEKRVGKYFYKDVDGQYVQLVPQPHQIRVLNYMNTNKGLILYHSTGTGKTLSALMCAVDFLLDSDENIVYIVVPPATVDTTWNKTKNLYINANVVKNSIRKKKTAQNRLNVPIEIQKRNRKRKLQQSLESARPVKKPRGSAQLKVQKTQQLLMMEKEYYDQAESIKNRIRIITTHKLKLQTMETGFIPPKKRYCMYIIDEAQNFVMPPLEAKKPKTEKIPKTDDQKVLEEFNLLREPIVVEGGEKIIKKKASFFIRKACVHIAAKILFLTATPIVNSFKDIRNMIQDIIIVSNPQIENYQTQLDVKRMEDVQDIVSFPETNIPKTIDFDIIDEKKMNDDKLQEYLHQFKCFFDYQESSTESGDFPTYEVKFHKIKADVEYARRATALKQEMKKSKRKSVALVKQRMASLRLMGDEEQNYLSKKIRFLLGDIPSDSTVNLNIATYEPEPETEQVDYVFPDLVNARTVVYFGIDVDYLEKKLKEMIQEKVGPENIRIGSIIGSSSAEQRVKAVEAFNNDRDEVKGRLLFISKAGAEGIDLKGVSHVVFLDGVWHQAAFDQIKGRGVRYKSHAGVEDKHVKIHILHLIDPEPKQQGFNIFADEAMDKRRLMKFKIINRCNPIFKTFQVKTPEELQQIKTPTPTMKTIRLPAQFYHPLAGEELDYAQALMIKLSQKTCLLFPDNAVSMFSNVYNRTGSEVFELVFASLKKHAEKFKPQEIPNNYLQIWYLEIKKETKAVNVIFPKIRPTKKGPLEEGKPYLFYLSLEESVSFGHYGVFFISPGKPRKIYYFDSMLSATTLDKIKQEDPDNYIFYFMRAIQKFFFIDFKRIEIELPDGCYSLEITGGSLYHPSKYIQKSIQTYPRITGNWILSSHMMNTDSQNHFCFMWALMYCICKVFHMTDNTIDWSLFQKEIIGKNQMIPLAVMKTFIYHTIPFFKTSAMVNDFWSHNLFVHKWFFSFVSNHPTNYSQTFNPQNKDFSLFKIGFPNKKKSPLTLLEKPAMFLLRVWTNFLSALVSNYGKSITPIDETYLNEPKLVAFINQKMKEDEIKKLERQAISRPNGYKKMVEDLEKLLTREEILLKQRRGTFTKTRFQQSLV